MQCTAYKTLNQNQNQSFSQNLISSKEKKNWG